MSKFLGLYLSLLLLLRLAGGIQGQVGVRGDDELQEGSKIESDTMGTWEMFSEDAGVSAMHLQIMPNNKAIMYDQTSRGPSTIKLPSSDNCLVNSHNETDCYAHAVSFDTVTGQVRPLKVESDVWCSSGGLSKDGTLVSTGGWIDGERSIRYIEDCDTCDFRESPFKLSDSRWYSTQVKLPDGQYVLLGGRNAFNYEFIPKEGNPSEGLLDLPFLQETTDLYENNLYPFVHLAPDENLFILANYKSILLDPINNVVIRTYPDIVGGARNFPGSGSSAILPLKLAPGQTDADDIEILVCGGGEPDALGKAENERVYLPALDTCGRMKFMQPNAQWEIEQMPSRRMMGDMLNLPNGQILLINGAQRGASGYGDSDEPNFTPVLYSPEKPAGQRFRNLQPTNVARLYHSTSGVLVDGKILVSGSNTNNVYDFDAKFPTEVRVEKFSPPYLDESLDHYRPVIDTTQVPDKAIYGKPIVVPFQSSHAPIQRDEMTMVLYHVPFVTHGFSVNQRMLELAIIDLTAGEANQWVVTAEAPNGGHLAPPGFYYLFITYRGVPGVGSWIQLLY